MYNETKLLLEYAKSWNNLNTSFLGPILADELIYTSQWVLEPINGSDEYISYISEKFATMRHNIVHSTLHADIGYFKGGTYSKDKPCLVITQNLESGQVKVAILIEHKDGLITEIAMCAIPNPNGAELFEMYPS